MISDEQCAVRENIARASGARAVYNAVADFLADEQRKGAVTQEMLDLSGEARKAVEAVHVESMTNMRKMLELENVAG